MTKQQTMEGVLRTNMRGVGFINDYENDISVRIEEDKLNYALPGDTVEVTFLGKQMYDQELGRMTHIIEEGPRKYIGIVEDNKGKLVVNAASNKLHLKPELLPHDAKSVTAGDKVFIHIVEWHQGTLAPLAEVIQNIGKSGEHETEIQSILLAQGIDGHFPKEVEDEAEKVAEARRELTDKDIATRRDFRGVLTMTIDPADAKDFDDALSFKYMDNGHYEVGIHIADVSYYVLPDSELDKEAYDRQFSTYLVDRTIPMLPEVLSNDLCSLNPNVVRRAFSVVVELDDNGHVYDTWFGRTLIESDRRFAYEDAQDVIDNGGEHETELRKMRDIAQKMEETKFANGAISFETDEVKFILGEDMKPVKVQVKTRLETHRMIEEYMLLANREVARHMTEAQVARGVQKGFVYRIHDQPDAERIGNLQNLVTALGHKFSIDPENVEHGAFGELFKQIEGTPEEGLIKTAAVRTMSKAIYSANNIGHYGLAFEHYTHFTSPIRRYADLMVHRLLQTEIENAEPKQATIDHNIDAMKHAETREKESVDAERTSIKLKQVEYMLDRIGQEFEGTISGVADWGIFVQDNETKSEGLVRLRDLPGNDFFEIDRATYSVIGKNSKKKFQLGDAVKFKVTAADLENKTIDMLLVE